MISEAEVRLPRAPGVIRRALAAHPVVVDVFIVVWFVLGSLFGVLLDLLSAANWSGTADPETWFGVPRYLEWPLWPLTAIRVAVVATALFFRRRYPLAGLIVVVLVMFGEQGMQGFANGVALLFMIYAVPVYRSVSAGWLGYGIAVVGSLLQLALDSRRAAQQLAQTGPAGMISADMGIVRSPTEFLGISLLTALWLLAILMLGINLGNRRRYLEAIIDRAHQLARERHQLAQLAVAEERSRIAREMHDIVAHSVSVMIALSEGAARAAEAAPEAAADAMHRSAETGRTALGEMRRLLGALHAPEDRAELVPQPGVQELPELVQSFTSAGLRVSLTVSGSASGDRGQELAVYRVVQEGLTNVLRYAGTGARATVEVARYPDRTSVEVRDYGRAAGSVRPVVGVGSGRGLAGLSERARVFGGHIESGPVTEAGGGGWRLWAVLPVSAAARTPHPEVSSERGAPRKPEEQTE
ncbi:sensor histidine kinase [Leucobacter chromiireducens]|uniref:histidine kinase n=1 Tax=Leucobacter chromiireducens subsp. chromiireducens TaxID=660067 RepID=A0ABS1SRV4_9MICO|nr:histidine kinase [Leucobacter chromiireducens]MBL3690884.1 two-component sensor histidine kinase [Leucobacter chromiireducens subsp. chromiireducens]